MHRKHLWFAKFSRTNFLENTSARLLLAFLYNFSKISVWKTSDEYFLSRSLRRTVQVHHFFLGSINFHFTVPCHKQPPEQWCSVNKGVFEEHLPTTAFALPSHHSLLLIALLYITFFLVITATTVDISVFLSFASFVLVAAHKMIFLS